jgi:hypothetical protein
MIHRVIADAVTAQDPEDVLSLLSVALNVMQTCFLAWLAVWARHQPNSNSSTPPAHQ